MHTPDHHPTAGPILHVLDPREYDAGIVVVRPLDYGTIPVVLDEHVRPGHVYVGHFNDPDVEHRWAVAQYAAINYGALLHPREHARIVDVPRMLGYLCAG